VRQLFQFECVPSLKWAQKREPSPLLPLRFSMPHRLALKIEGWSRVFPVLKGFIPSFRPCSRLFTYSIVAKGKSVAKLSDITFARFTGDLQHRHLKKPTGKSSLRAERVPRSDQDNITFPEYSHNLTVSIQLCHRLQSRDGPLRSSEPPNKVKTSRRAMENRGNKRIWH
jgi:hypothetical protein